ncbi:NAD-dependent epimerase/dehydratase family protein [Chengkuizengella marina]|uniref:NAD-dependent epimerase/dehydratase family protein n=1 Tax=Chengkuizengella marina TaxID=2507566 RepID=A0A6N9Q1Q3_9BACL|nr:NAD-dependent epimerase/dehydratase family protein [Chengkuizengella marina]NBI28190.1 NAD-dependent epimerase/dehydratase family protein [Chengkuizengella marina]
MKKKVLITGSNGVLGKNLIQYLEDHYRNDYELHLLDVAQPEDQTSKHKTNKGDIRSKKDVEKVIKDIDIVVHCASASPSYKESEIFDIIINGTSNLLNCSFEIGNVERFIYISSTSVYGVPEKAPIFENDEVKPYDPYNKGKIEAEKRCLQWRAKGKCITILRPRSFLGPHRLGTFGILYEWASEKRNFPMLGAGKNKYQLLDVEDLCQAICLSMSVDKQNANDLFNIGAKEFTNIKEDYQAVLHEAGYNKKIISIPVFPMIIILSILEKLKLSPFYKRLYKKLNRNYYVSIEKAEKQLGYNPKYSNKDALIRNYHWYLRNQKKYNTAGLSNNAVWNQGVLKYAKYFF